MSWQDELQRLDSELASGQITRQEYRKLRDELLASASGSSSRFAKTYLSQPADQAGAPNQSGPPWPPAPTPANINASTAPVAPATHTGNRTAFPPTTAPSPADLRPTESIRYPNFDQQYRPTHRSTTSLPSGLPPKPPMGPPTEPTTPDERLDHPFTAVYDRRRPTWLYLALAVFLVLALVLAGIWWLANKEGQPAEPAPTAAPPPPASLEDRLPTLPGKPSSANSTVTVAKGAELQLYNATYTDLMKANGAEEVIYRSSTDGASGTDGYLLLVIRTPSPTQAKTLASGLAESATKDGLTSSLVSSPWPGTALSGSNASGQVSAFWYVSGSITVGVGVSQATGGDFAVLDQRLKQTLATLAEPLPPR